MHFSTHDRDSGSIMVKFTRDQRQELILQIVGQEKIANQSELIEKMRRQGVETNQATVSRDLSDLQLGKSGGYYRIPEKKPESSRFQPSVRLLTAGDHMIVLRTPPGQASFVAAMLDDAAMSEIAGTIAGDDTIFIACASLGDQKKVIRYIKRNF